MYTDELLEEKYKAQKELAERAEKEKKDYFKIIEEEVKELFEKKAENWNFPPGKADFYFQYPGTGLCEIEMKII